MSVIVYISLCCSYLKLYTTLPLSKLATFMGSGPSQDENRDLKKEIEALIIHLLCFKHKMKNVVWTKGTSGLEGKFQSGSEVGMELLMYRHRNTIHPLLRGQSHSSPFQIFSLCNFLLSTHTLNFKYSCQVSDILHYSYIEHCKEDCRIHPFRP